MTVFTVVLACVALVTPIAFGLPQGVLHSSLGGSSSGGPSSSGPSSSGPSSSAHSHGPIGSSLDPQFTTTTTYRPPIPIIRHINRVNNDGSYTFGYESGDGSYRVETRGLDGLTQGRYGYIDEGGVRKEVDYLAGSATGYEPRGQGITVPPRLPPLAPGAVVDDGSWKPETIAPPIATRTRARDFVPEPQAPLSPVHHHHQQPPAPQPQPPPQQPQPQQPQRTFTPPGADFHFPSQSAPMDFSHRQINAPSPPQPIDFGQQPFSQPAPAPQPAPQPVFRQPQQPAAPARASPIEQFLRQQLNSGPQQPQPQQQPITRQLF